MHARKHERRAEAGGFRRRHVDRHLVRGERPQFIQQGRQLGYRHARAGAAGIDQLAVIPIVAELQRAEGRARPFRIGPADDHEFLAVQKLGLDPDAAVAGQVGLVDLLRDHAFDAELRPRLGYLRIPTKPAMHSEGKPATGSDLKPATQRSLPRIGAMMLRRDGSVKRAPILGLRRPRRMVGS